MSLGVETIEIVGPAVAAGLMIALVHAPLGIEVIRRGIVFVDLAVAQIAGLGLVIAGALLHVQRPWLTQGIALACAVAAGLLFRKVETFMPRQREAVIGCAFVLAASLAILLLADHPRDGEQIRHLLSGQVLFITWADVLRHMPAYVLILAAWFVRPALRDGAGFYLLFALAITSSVQLVGVYVVFASLILPALAAVGAGAGRHYRAAWLCGVAAVPSGIAVAALFDLPAGPVIVASYCVAAAAIRVGRALYQPLRWS